MAAETRDDASAGAPRGGRPCPICGKPSSPATRPFCSKRCADIDLHRWLGGVYVVPEAEASSEPVVDRDADDV